MFLFSFSYFWPHAFGVCKCTIYSTIYCISYTERHELIYGPWVLRHITVLIFIRVDSQLPMHKLLGKWSTFASTATNNIVADGNVTGRHCPLAIGDRTLLLSIFHLCIWCTMHEIRPHTPQYVCHYRIWSPPSVVMRAHFYPLIVVCHHLILYNIRV